MIIVERFDGRYVEFHCTKCGFEGMYDLVSQLSDNCVIDVDVCCDLCNDMSVLYITMCKEEARAKELLATLKVLKEKRVLEEEINGN